MMSAIKNQRLNVAELTDCLIPWPNYMPITAGAKARAEIATPPNWSAPRDASPTASAMVDTVNERPRARNAVGDGLLNGLVQVW
ncbi:hypothetical protein GV67_14000 [Pseudorhizobium pelagicum]|nr:hypothetical protein GV67_14000 [Pseudorhizobium pelagicum]